MTAKSATIGEGVPTGQSHKITAEEAKARRVRNLAVAGAVLAFVLIIYFTTLLRLIQNIGGGAA